MSLSNAKKSKIVADIKAGKLNKTKIAQKWRISRTTLIKIIKEFSVGFGENKSKVNKKIEQKATRAIIERESRKLIDYTKQHLDALQVIRDLTKANLEDITAAAAAAKKEGGSLHKEASDNFFAFQKVCKIASETLINCYKDERLAFGINDNKSETVLSLGEIRKEDVEKVQSLFDDITQ